MNRLVLFRYVMLRNWWFELLLDIVENFIFGVFCLIFREVKESLFWKFLVAPGSDEILVNVRVHVNGPGFIRSLLSFLYLLERLVLNFLSQSLELTDSVGDGRGWLFRVLRFISLILLGLVVFGVRPRPYRTFRRRSKVICWRILLADKIFYLLFLALKV